MFRWVNVFTLVVQYFSMRYHSTKLAQLTGYQRFEVLCKNARRVRKCFLCRNINFRKTTNKHNALQRYGPPRQHTHHNTSVLLASWICRPFSQFFAMITRTVEFGFMASLLKCYKNPTYIQFLLIEALYIMCSRVLSCELNCIVVSPQS